MREDSIQLTNTSPLYTNRTGDVYEVLRISPSGLMTLKDIKGKIWFKYPDHA